MANLKEHIPVFVRSPNSSGQAEAKCLELKRHKVLGGGDFAAFPKAREQYQRIWLT